MKASDARDPETREQAHRQFVEAKGPTMITCECKRRNPVRFMYHCLYCDCWFCKECAEIHFGKTVEQYYDEIRKVVAP